MATSKGRAEVSRFIAMAPGQIRKLLRGAGRAGGNVIAEEAKDRSISKEVSDSVEVKVSAKQEQIIVKIQTAGPGSYLAPWLEWGTAPHFISVDASQREGRSVARINKLHKAGSLVIGGTFVGDTVFHPGARPHPFLRPALDTKEREAIAAAQAYIDVRVKPGGVDLTGVDAGE